MLTFYLKKIIGMLLMPISMSILLLLAALLLWHKRPRLSKAMVVVATLCLLLTSWHPVADRLIRPFELDYPAFDVRQSVDAVVVLGGCHNTDESMPPVAQLCSSSLFRLMEGLRILAANPQAKLLVSGYAGSDSRPHAEVMQEAAESLGLASERILAFPTPRDTQEEAQQMFAELSGKRFALVSENSHLPRAMVFFEAQGLAPIAAPALKLSAEDSDWRLGAYAALKSERAAYEWLGTLWQKIKKN